MLLHTEPSLHALVWRLLFGPAHILEGIVNTLTLSFVSTGAPLFVARKLMAARLAVAEAERIEAGGHHNVWEEAVKDQCVVYHVNWDDTNPHVTLKCLLARACEIALDPLVSDQAPALPAVDGAIDVLRDVYMTREQRAAYDSLRAQLAAAEAERDEQCKLLAAGVERELNFQLRASRAEAERDRAVKDAEALRALIDSPHNADWFEGVRIEAAHQVTRWGVEHDAGKEPQDWFWLTGYLAGKALKAAIDGDAEKAKHHTISTAAVMRNWHRALSGETNAMRPGIDSTALDAAIASAAGEAGSGCQHETLIPTASPPGVHIHPDHDEGFGPRVGQGR